jgi:hypothetical protein
VGGGLPNSLDQRNPRARGQIQARERRKALSLLTEARECRHHAEPEKHSPAASFSRTCGLPLVVFRPPDAIVILGRGIPEPDDGGLPAMGMWKG